MNKKVVEISPLNRVEGDLKVKVEIENGKVVNAYCSGVTFRGFEMILRGRDPVDPLVITPRICGICGTAHLSCAARALDMLYEAEVPPNGLLVRNICLAIETIASSITHIYALFNVDFVNEKYRGRGIYTELKKRFAPFNGSSYIEALKARRTLLGIVAILGGQWPHSHYMVPGGVTSTPTSSELMRARAILTDFHQFAERVIFGGILERWLENKSFIDVERWLNEGDHSGSDLGLFIKYGREFGLDKMGQGCGNFLSYGGYELPQENGKTWLRSGFFDGKRYLKFDQRKISEHVNYSWYENRDGGTHPFNGTTVPKFNQSQGEYSWSKAPRYDGQVVEVGPMARMRVDEDPLFKDILKKMGPSAFVRMLARYHECAKLLLMIKDWLREIEPADPFYKKPKNLKNLRGFGLAEAPRGALGHWSVIENGKIKNYQVITPTTWNCSPRDSMGVPGTMEQALVGTPVRDEDNLTEVYHVVRSFDPCLVCTVHAINRPLGKSKQNIY
jgi:hydrogenase large subunit